MKQRKILKKSAFTIIYCAVIVMCVVLDQLTKLWIFDGLLQGGDLTAGIDVLGKFLRFEPVYNDAAAFGIGSSDAANILFFVITLLGIPLFCWLMWRSRTRSVWGQIGFAFIVGGTIGNAIDRAFVHNTTGAFYGGEVRDFIAFSIFPPVFNVADSFLTIGVAMAILAILFFDPDGLLATVREEKAEKNANVGSSSTEDAAEKQHNECCCPTEKANETSAKDESDLAKSPDSKGTEVGNAAEKKKIDAVELTDSDLSESDEKNTKNG